MAERGRSFPLSVVISAVDKITGPMKRVAGTLAGTGSVLKNLNERSGLPILTASLGLVGDAAKGLGQRIMGIAGLATKVTAAFGLSAAGLTAFAQSYADATGAIGDVAEQTGISRERFQELSYAAQLSGSSAEELGGALKKMGLTIGNLQGGSKELKKMFDGLQISLKNTNGTSKTTDELFDTIVNRISRIKDPALQAKAAVTIFGESATKLLPLLRGGNKGIAEMAAEARRLGVVLSEDAVQDGEAFGDVLDKLKFAFSGVTNTIGSTLVPTLAKLGEQLTETFIQYRPAIEQFAKQFAENLPRYLEQTGSALTELWRAFKPVGSTILDLAKNFGTIKVAMYTVAGLIVASLIPGLVALTTSLYTVGLAMVATPIGLFLTSIAALAAAAFLVYKNWDQFASFFTERFDAVKAGFKTGLIDGIVALWKQFNPAGLIIDSVSSVVKYLTGLDLKKLAGKLVSDITGGMFGGGEDEGKNQPLPTSQVLPKELEGRGPLPVAKSAKPLEQKPFELVASNALKDQLEAFRKAKPVAAQPVAPVPESLKKMQASNQEMPVQKVPVIKQERLVKQDLRIMSQPVVRERAIGPDPEKRALPSRPGAAAPVAKSEAKVTVDFKNLPQATQVKSESRGGADIKVNQGYSMIPMANA